MTRTNPWIKETTPAKTDNSFAWNEAIQHLHSDAGLPVAEYKFRFEQGEPVCVSHPDVKISCNPAVWRVFGIPPKSPASAILTIWKALPGSTVPENCVRMLSMMDKAGYNNAVAFKVGPNKVIQNSLSFQWWKESRLDLTAGPWNVRLSYKTNPWG